MEKDKMKKETKSIIFETAIKLFSEKGYHGTSMRELAKAVGIKESSLYNHYSGKSDIFKAILDYQLESFKNAENSLLELKKESEVFSNPVEIWLAGLMRFIKEMPPLSEIISRIIVNEMYLDKQCREFVLQIMFPAQKNLTERLLLLLFEKGLIRECDFNKTASQYVYMIYGLEIENRLLIMEGADFNTVQKNLIDHIKLFIENLK